MQNSKGTTGHFVMITFFLAKMASKPALEGRRFFRESSIELSWHQQLQEDSKDLPNQKELVSKETPAQLFALFVKTCHYRNIFNYLRAFIRSNLLKNSYHEISSLSTCQHATAGQSAQPSFSAQTITKSIALFFSIAICLLARGDLHAQEKAQDSKSKILIVEGQNNHSNWPTTSRMMKAFLEQTKKFQVDIIRTKPKGVDNDFAPDFKKYDAVLSNYNGTSWPESTKKAFEQYMKNGGGLVVIHAADNSFPKWKEFNQMIGLGGWGGRNQNSGPYVYYNQKGEIVTDKKKGRGGSHGKQHPFQLVMRDRNHPITKGIPQTWWHQKDELYDSLRGPAENMKVLATAFSDKKTGGSGRHEPMLMVLSYGKGRVFHCPMGHSNQAHRCIGFVTLLRRGTQWASGKKVDIPVPENFPTEKVVLYPNPVPEKVKSK